MEKLTLKPAWRIECTACQVSEFHDGSRYTPESLEEATELYAASHEIDVWQASSVPEDELMGQEYYIIPNDKMCKCGKSTVRTCYKFNCPTCKNKNYVDLGPPDISEEERLSKIMEMMDIDATEAWKVTEEQIASFEVVRKPAAVSCASCSAVFQTCTCPECMAQIEGRGPEGEDYFGHM